MEQLHELYCFIPGLIHRSKPMIFIQQQQVLALMVFLADFMEYPAKQAINVVAACSLFAICKHRTKCYICDMKSHNGMRPQDIVLLLKILNVPEPGWQYRDLAASVYLSISEISESLNRSHIAGLIDESKRKVHRQQLMEFIIYGLPYVFPQVPGTMVTGIPTAHSHPFYAKLFKSELNYAWPDDNGNMRGLLIQPLYSSVVKAAKQDEILYKLLASIDIIRVGRTRELKVATEELKKNIL